MGNSWSEKTWTDLQARKPDVVLLPVGSVEAHGPHLPLSTDTIISEEVARRAAEELSSNGKYSLVLPPLQYVITDFSKDFPGTISISKKSFHSILNDISDALHAQEINRLCIVNSHLEPDHIHAIREFCNSYSKMTVLFPDKTKKPWASMLTAEFKQGACHAGSYETSLVLAKRQDLVRDTRKELSPYQVNLAELMKEGIKSFRQAGALDGYFGDPASATVEEGEKTYRILTTMVVDTVLSSY